MVDKLTPKQRAFVRAYKTNGGNGTQAAIEAGYSENTARIISSQNLTKINVKEAIEEHEAKLQEKYNYTVDDMMRELNELIQDSKVNNNLGVRAKAIELKGKAMGLFVEKSDVTLNQPPVSLVEIVNSKGEVVDVGSKKDKTA